MRSTKIVATLGPASNDADTLERMIAAGLDVARLNFAHGDAEEHAGRVERLRAAAERVGREVAILCDIPGPKLRIGPVAGGHTELHTGSHVVLTTEAIDGTAERLPVDWKGLPELMKPGDVAYLADGSIRLRVVEPGETEVLTEVEVGGFLASRQGINLPNVTTSLPAVSDDDLDLIDAGATMGVDMVALCFVRRREDLEPVRNHMTAKGYDLPLIAKIEKPQAAANAEEIIDAADGVMVARGDLGIELPIEEVPARAEAHPARRRASGPSRRSPRRRCSMSMVTSTRPTRAEVTDVANAIFDGTDAVMLSQETAVGEHPVLAVADDGLHRDDHRARASLRALAGGARPAEVGRGRRHRLRGGGSDHALDLSALVVPTYTGTTARLISSHRPSAPVLAICPDQRIATALRALLGRAHHRPPGARGHHRADRDVRARRHRRRHRHPRRPHRHHRRTACRPQRRDEPVQGPHDLGQGVRGQGYGLGRQYAKLCDVRDWHDPDLLRVLRDILPERDPVTHVERKVWEFAQLALFLEETGRLHEDTEALAIGAGDERIVFWLANRLGRVRGHRHLRRGRLRGPRGRSLDARRPGGPRPVPLPGGPARGALDGRTRARLPGRELRRRVLAVVDRALRLAGRDRPLGRARWGGCCGPAVTPSW